MAVPSREDIAQIPGAMERPADRLMAEAMTIIDTARRHDAQLRLTGGLAVRRYVTDLAFMDRQFSDIDFIGLSSDTARLQRVLAELGYQENRYVTQATGARSSSTSSAPGRSSRAPISSSGRVPWAHRTSRPRWSITSTSSWMSCAWTTTSTSRVVCTSTPTPSRRPTS